MPKPAQLIPVCYYPSSADWFVQIRHMPSPIWLDSGYPGSQYGRFDIMAAAPAVSLTTTGELTRINHIDGQASETSAQNPFELLKSYLPPKQPHLPESPFAGGILGYFGYDLGRRLEQLPSLAKRDISLPDMAVGIYPWAIVQDHQDQRAWLVLNPSLATAYNFSSIQALCSHTHQKDRFHDLKQNITIDDKSFGINGFESNLNVENYSSAIAAIQNYINAGDCYQVNFAQRFVSEYKGDSLAAYLALREVLPSPFSAYMELAEGAVLSLSPERFIKLDGDYAETKPIKGTMPRGKTPEKDAKNAQLLSSSLKDRAENLMIVDLLRNDLSKTCDEVQVPELFGLQSFANVHHLVSTVTGRLKPGMTALDLLASSFPGGSITGAPKIRAMEIIEELEPTRRSVYCGSLGYISACGNMDTNIAIRTLVCDEKLIYCWGGGGIVADSEADQEYAESLAKVQVLMDNLEQKFKAGTH